MVPSFASGAPQDPHPMCHFLFGVLLPPFFFNEYYYWGPASHCAFLTPGYFYPLFLMRIIIGGVRLPTLMSPPFGP